MTKPFGQVEMALVELIETRYPDATGKVGGDLGYDGSQDFYIWLGLIPGGTTDQIYGTWYVDLDVFSTSYAEAMGRALDLETILISPRHVTSVMRLDNAFQNMGPSERPWSDDNVFRIGATYGFTARRSG